MHTILTITTIICVGYMAYSMKDGVPESLSATYYQIKHPWVFRAVMFAMGIGL